MYYNKSDANVVSLLKHLITVLSLLAKMRDDIVPAWREEVRCSERCPMPSL